MNLFISFIILIFDRVDLYFLRWILFFSHVYRCTFVFIRLCVLFVFNKKTSHGAYEFIFITKLIFDFVKKQMIIIIIVLVFYFQSKIFGFINRWNCKSSITIMSRRLKIVNLFFSFKLRKIELCLCELVKSIFILF